MNNSIDQNLKKLAASYYRGEMCSITCCPFELKAGDHRSYPTLKDAIIFPTAGEATFQLDYLSFHMKQGKCLHACPGKQLTIMNHGSTVFRYIVIYYNGKCPMLFEARLTNYDYLVLKLNQILSYEEGLPLNSYRKEILIGEFFKHLFDSLQPVDITTDADLMKMTLDYIHDNYSKKITLSALAEQVGTSVDHLSYLFRKNLNICPIDYLIDYRIKLAIHLLQDSEGKSVSQIAESIGYSDAAQFSHIFKKRVGVSPGTLRGR